LPWTGQQSKRLPCTYKDTWLLNLHYRS
jgi:hypothetical protein